MAEPIRPVRDGNLIQYSLTTTFPSNLKNLLLTTVKDEGGSAIYDAIRDPLPPAYSSYALDSIYGNQSSAIGAQYKVAEADTDDARPNLVVIATDSAWRCPDYTFARKWASRGGNVWVGEFTVGATYPVNAQFSYCTSNGAVCHQDDIPIVFGTATSPTAAQTALTAQIQARWGAFVKTGNPNTSGFQNWSQVPYNGVIPVQNLGGGVQNSLGGCDPSVWGNTIKYEYQIYGQ